MSNQHIERPLQEVLREQMDSIAPAPAFTEAPALPEHQTIMADNQSLGEIVEPENETFVEDATFEDEADEIELESDEEIIDEEIEEEAAITETQLRIIPTATLLFRAIDDETHREICAVRNYTAQDGNQYDLANPLASGKRRGKPSGRTGILRTPIADMLNYLGTVINQNTVYIGSALELQHYVNVLFNKVERRVNEIIYGDDSFIVGESNGNEFSIEKASMFSVCSELNLVSDPQNHTATVYVEFVLTIHVAQLLADIGRAESVLRNYMKYIHGTLSQTGIKDVETGVVFDVSSLVRSTEARQLFTALLSGELAVSVDQIISKSDEQQIPACVAFETGGGNALVMLKQEQTEEVSE